MTKAYVREGVMIAAALMIGWWARGVDRQVAAASAVPSNLVYQFSNAGPGISLTMYNPGEQMLYVYQGATMGNSHVNCSYRFHIQQPGAPIERENCAIGSLLPQR
jgi:hypothetical protein